MKSLAKIPFNMVTTLQPKDQQTIVKALKLLIENSDLMYKFNLQSPDDIMSKFNFLLRDLKSFFIQCILYPNEIKLRSLLSFSYSFKGLAVNLKDITGGNHTVFSSALLAVSCEFELWFNDVFNVLNDGQ